MQETHYNKGGHIINELEVDNSNRPSKVVDIEHVDLHGTDDETARDLAETFAPMPVKEEDAVA